MLKKGHRQLGVLIGMILFQSCFGDEATPVLMPGYNSSIPASQTSMTSKKSTEKLASPGDLDDVVKSVKLGEWSTFSTYMWTCTPYNFILVTANAKNTLRMEFDQLVQQNQVPTLSEAKKIAETAQQIVNYRIMGLYGNACQLIINYPQTKKTALQSFNCFFDIRSGRYLSQLATVIAASNGKTDLVPDETLQALTNFEMEYCKKL